MPGFDPEIGKLAQRVLINPRKIDYHTGVFATKVIRSSYVCVFLLLVVCLNLLHSYFLFFFFGCTVFIFFWCFSQITPAKNGKPVTIELIDAKTKEPKDTLEVS